MAKRTSTRKSKVFVVPESDSIGSQSTSRRSSRISRRMSTESPTKLPIGSTNQSPNSTKELPNLSQYFPSRKRSQSSPRNMSSDDSKYTRIKSPDGRFRKRLMDDNPISYGEFDHSFDGSSPKGLTETPNKTKVKTTVLPKNMDNSENKKSSIDFKGLLNSFKSVMDEVVEEDIEMTTDYNQSHYNLSQELNDSVDNDLSQMISGLKTKQKPDNEVNHYVNPIPCHSRDIQLDPISNQKTSKQSSKQILKSISKPQELMSKNDIQSKVVSNTCDSNRNQDNSFDDDFDDSFDELLYDMEFPIEEQKESIDNCCDVKPQIEINSDNKTNGEEDDGFESDGDFERLLSQIPNEELAKNSNLDDSVLDRSLHNTSTSSMSSSGLITLSQIIDLINQD